MMNLFLALLVVISTSFLAYPAHASKGDVPLQTVPETLGRIQNERPFRTTAIVEGMCRHVEVPLSDSRKVKWLYQADNAGAEGSKLRKVGLLYFNNHSQEAVCFDELAVRPFVEKNVHGDIVSISGWVAPGSNYGLDQEEIIITESIELLD